MTALLTGRSATVLLCLAAAATYLAVVEAGLPPGLSERWARYRRGWRSSVAFLRVDRRWGAVPLVQPAAVVLFAGVALASGTFWLAAPAVLAALLPPWILLRLCRQRIDCVSERLDGFLTSLADTLTTVPNLTEALSNQVELTEPPIRDEVREVLAEVRLGRTLEDALRNMAARLRLPGLDAAVGAALLGKRTGGDLPGILRRIAETLREMGRLEGVVRTKTAEGRTQAWVMGGVPPGMILLLEKVDPDWLSPMWEDPIGWLLLGAAAVLEVAAVALIRKIMAVEI